MASPGSLQEAFCHQGKKNRTRRPTRALSNRNEHNCSLRRLCRASQIPTTRDASICHPTIVAKFPFWQKNYLGAELILAATVVSNPLLSVPCPLLHPIMVAFTLPQRQHVFSASAILTGLLLLQHLSTSLRPK
jgi:hypothetical protein